MENQNIHCRFIFVNYPIIALVSYFQKVQSRITAITVN